MTAYLLKKFTHDTVFLDIGANIGYYTLLAAPLVKSVIAFEPQKRPHTFLEQSIKQAGYTNVTVYGFPLFSGVVQGTMNPKGMFRPIQGGELRSVSLDSMNLKPDVIKVDVEGSELDVLEGAERTLRTYKPILAIEIHHRRLTKFGRTYGDVSQFLRDMGYKIIPLVCYNDVLCGTVGAEWVF